MLATAQVGPQVLQDGAQGTARAGRTGELNTSDAHGRFYESAARGTAFYLAAGAAAPTAFTGGAGGTPLIGVYNPTASGKNLVFLAASLGVTAVPTAAGVVNPELWSGVSALPTGTATNPISMLTQRSSGSVAVGFVNAAMTGSTAITITAALTSFWWATAAAGSTTTGGFNDLGGIVIASPGVLVALGLRTVPLSTTVSVSLFWEEVPV